MKSLTTLALIVLGCSILHGQTVTELFDSKKFKELTKFEKKADELTPDELFKVGFAFFRLENDDKAIEFYDKAIAKGLDNGSVFFYKGLSLYYQKKYDDALKQIDLALEKEPTNQEYMNQKGEVYRIQGQEDTALIYYEKAVKLPNTYGEPFFWIAYVYHGKKDFKKALDLYYVALDSVSKWNSHYQTTLESIGKLEYSYTKNYLKSAWAYTKALEIEPENYELYYKTIKSYNAAKEYDKADSLFSIVKTAFEKGKLPKEDMEIKTISIAQFEWNGQIATIRKSLVDPKEDLDISYKVFLLNKEGDAVERRFVVEKTMQLEENGPKYLLCEQDKKNGGHITYPYGWSTDIITAGDLEKAVKLVLDGKMKQAASSYFKK